METLVIVGRIHETIKKLLVTILTDDGKNMDTCKYLSGKFKSADLETFIPVYIGPILYTSSATQRFNSLKALKLVAKTTLARTHDDLCARGVCPGDFKIFMIWIIHMYEMVIETATAFDPVNLPLDYIVNTFVSVDEIVQSHIYHNVHDDNRVLCWTIIPTQLEVDFQHFSTASFLGVYGCVNKRRLKQWRMKLLRLYCLHDFCDIRTHIFSYDHLKIIEYTHEELMSTRSIFDDPFQFSRLGGMVQPQVRNIPCHLPHASATDRMRYTNLFIDTEPPNLKSHLVLKGTATATGNKDADDYDDTTTYYLILYDQNHKPISKQSLNALLTVLFTRHGWLYTHPTLCDEYWLSSAHIQGKSSLLTSFKPNDLSMIPDKTKTQDNIADRINNCISSSISPLSYPVIVIPEASPHVVSNDKQDEKNIRPIKTGDYEHSRLILHDTVSEIILWLLQQSYTEL